MSDYGKLMFRAALVVAIGYGGVFFLLTEGLRLGTHGAGFLGLVMFGFTGFVAGTLFVISARRTPLARAMPDEREALLDIKSEQIGYRVLELAVFVIMALGLYEKAAGPGALGSYSMTRPEGLIFALLSAVALAGMARLLSAALMDRRA